MSRTRSLFATVIIARLWLLALCACYEFYDEKVSSLGLTVQLYCNNSAQYRTAPRDAEPVAWLLPDLTVLYGDQGRFQLLNNNWTLKIVNVSNDHLGLYHCILRTADAKSLVLRLGLNAAGPYFEHLWDKYTPNTVVGFSASSSFLLIAVAVCLVYHFRYRSGDTQQAGSTSGEVTGDDGTVVGVVNKNTEMRMVREKTEQCAPSSVGREEMTSCYVTDSEAYSGNMDQQCNTRL